MITKSQRNQKGDTCPICGDSDAKHKELWSKIREDYIKDGYDEDEDTWQHTLGLILENCPHEKTKWCINCKTTEHWSDEYKKCPKYAEAQDILRHIAFNGGTFKEI